MRLLHVCEVCGKTEILTPEEAFDQGWDYPPVMGTFGVISPRTCGNCAIDGTLWWALNAGMRIEDLNMKQLETLRRIMQEPESIMIREDDSRE